MVYNYSNIKELKKAIYLSDDHDAEIVWASYDKNMRQLVLRLYNPAISIKSESVYIFYEISALFLLNRDPWCADSGDHTIIGITVESEMPFRENPGDAEVVDLSGKLFICID